MEYSTPGLPVHHQLLEFTQIHVLWVGDAIQPSHSLLPLLLLPSDFPSIRVFSNELALRIRWPKYRTFNFSISPSNEYSGLISFRTGSLISLQFTVVYLKYWKCLWSDISGCNNKKQILIFELSKYSDIRVTKEISLISFKIIVSKSVRVYLMYFLDIRFSNPYR